MTDEYLRAMRELWTNPDPSFAGKYVQFGDVVFRPPPAQKPHPPIWVGGHTRPALRRTIEFGDAWHPINRTPAELRAGRAELERLGQQRGRERLPALAPRLDARLVLDDRGGPPPAHAGHMLEGTPDDVAAQVEELRQLGTEHLVLEFAARDAEHFFAQAEAFARDVRPRLAG